MNIWRLYLHEPSYWVLGQTCGGEVAMSAQKENREMSRLLVASIVATMLILPMAVAAQESSSYRFDLANQTVSEALRNYGQIVGQQIIFTEDVVAGLRTTTLRGDYTAQAALDHLLKDTGLIAERSPSGALMIRKANDGSDSGASRATGVGEPADMTGQLLVQAIPQDEEQGMKMTNATNKTYPKRWLGALLAFLTGGGVSRFTSTWTKRLS